MLLSGCKFVTNPYHTGSRWTSSTEPLRQVKSTAFMETNLEAFCAKLSANFSAISWWLTLISDEAISSLDTIWKIGDLRRILSKCHHFKDFFRETSFHFNHSQESLSLSFYRELVRKRVLSMASAIKFIELIYSTHRLK